ncbi:cytochrome P450, partial [Bacillus pseudomycoides]
TLLRRMPNLQIQGEREQVKWKESYLMRSLEELPLQL